MNQWIEDAARQIQRIKSEYTSKSEIAEIIEKHYAAFCRYKPVDELATIDAAVKKATETLFVKGDGYEDAC